MADFDIAYDPISLNFGPLTIAGLDNIKFAVTQPIETALTLHVPETVKTDSKATISVPDVVRGDAKVALSFPEPIRTESRGELDLKPVAIDQCLRLSLGPLPPTQVCLPNRQRIGFTLFGMEVFGVTLDGEARILVGDLPKAPHVVAAPAHGPPHAAKPAAGPGHVGSGLVVRLGV